MNKPGVPNPKFEKIVEVSGVPVAQFRSEYFCMDMPDTHVINKESLINRICAALEAGRWASAEEDIRALKALDAAIKEWAKKPWDGK